MIKTYGELELFLGENIKTLRLQKNLDRQTLCDRAGVSVSALRHLESGQGAAIKTLIRVVRALEREDWLSGLAPQISVNPLNKTCAPRQRASRRMRNHGKKEKS